MSSPLEARTRRFVHSLADGPVGATNISAERTGSGVEVTCSLPGPDVNKAQSIAAGHGFTLHGKAGPGEYRFSTHVAAGEAEHESPGGFDLPGGVR